MDLRLEESLLTNQANTLKVRFTTVQGIAWSALALVFKLREVLKPSTQSNMPCDTIASHEYEGTKVPSRDG